MFIKVWSKTRFPYLLKNRHIYLAPTQKILAPKSQLSKKNPNKKRKYSKEISLNINNLIMKVIGLLLSNLKNNSSASKLYSFSNYKNKTNWKSYKISRKMRMFISCPWLPSKCCSNLKTLILKSFGMLYKRPLYLLSSQLKTPTKSEALASSCMP